jgi:hypothetical protein
METENKFYPDLSPAGEVEAQLLIDRLKIKARKAIEEVLDDYFANAYCDIIPDIESDSWHNFRNSIMDGFKGYDNKITARYDFVEIRKKIFEEFHDEIIKDLNQDLVEENKRLKETIDSIQELRRMGY